MYPEASYTATKMNEEELRYELGRKFKINLVKPSRYRIVFGSH